MRVDNDRQVRLRESWRKLNDTLESWDQSEPLLLEPGQRCYGKIPKSLAFSPLFFANGIQLSGKNPFEVNVTLASRSWAPYAMPRHMRATRLPDAHTIVFYALAKPEILQEWTGSLSHTVPFAIIIRRFDQAKQLLEFNHDWLKERAPSIEVDSLWQTIEEYKNARNLTEQMEDLIARSVAERNGYAHYVREGVDRFGYGFILRVVDRLLDPEGSVDVQHRRSLFALFIDCYSHDSNMVHRLVSDVLPLMAIEEESITYVPSSRSRFSASDREVYRELSQRCRRLEELSAKSERSEEEEEELVRLRAELDAFKTPIDRNVESFYEQRQHENEQLARRAAELEKRVHGHEDEDDS